MRTPGGAEPIGILPAAGVASRLTPFRYPKELLPIVFAPDRRTGRVRPLPAIEYALEAMRRASVKRCLVVIADWKTELVRILGDGAEAGVRVAYLHRAVPRGLADAIDAGHPWFEGRQVCLALPDTIFYPTEAIRAVRAEATASGADLVLGVFPASRPEDLGPVRVGADGSVLEVLEKPAATDLRNTWGVAVWSPRLSDLLHERVGAREDAGAGPELALGHVFQAAVGRGFSVRAVEFPEGSYVDLGRAESVGSLLLRTDPRAEGGATEAEA